jgi:hypothetical protein
MNNERDPLLVSLFRQAERELIDEDFTTNVMAGIDRRRRGFLIGRLSVVVLLIVFELVMNTPIQNSVGTLTGIMSKTLIELENEWLTYALGPLNSIAGVLGVTLLAMQFLFRKVLR